MATRKFRVYLESGATFTVEADAYSIGFDEVVFMDEQGIPLRNHYISSSLVVAIVPVDATIKKKEILKPPVMSGDH